LFELLADAWREIIVVPIDGGLAIQFCRDDSVLDYSVVVPAPKPPPPRQSRPQQTQQTQRGRKGGAWDRVGNSAPVEKSAPAEKVDARRERPAAEPPPPRPQRPPVPQAWTAAWPIDEVATIPLPEWAAAPRIEDAPVVDESAGPNREEGEARQPAASVLKGGAWATAKISVYDEAVDGPRIAPGLQKMLNDKGRKTAEDDRKPREPGRQQHGRADQHPGRHPPRTEQQPGRPPQPPDQQTGGPPPPRPRDAGRAAWSKVTGRRGAHRGGK
jgi:hypothetical protein